MYRALTRARTHTRYVLCSVLLTKTETERKMKKWEPMREKRTIALSLRVCVVRMYCIVFLQNRIESACVITLQPVLSIRSIEARERENRWKKRVSASLRISFTSIRKMCGYVSVSVALNAYCSRSCGLSIAVSYDKISHSARGCLNRLRQWGSVHSKS